MTNIPLTITIMAVLIIGICLGVILENKREVCSQNPTMPQCVEMCNKSMAEEKGHFIDACRKLCNTNDDCKYRCLNGIPEVEADI